MSTDYQTDYYPNGEDLKDIRKPSTTYNNSNLTIGQERSRQLENAGLARGADSKAVNPQRIINSATSKSRIRFNASNLLNKTAGVEQFNPYTTDQPKPVVAQPKPATQPTTPWYELDKMSAINLKYRGLTGNQDIESTKLKIREVDTLANDEANRALGNELKVRNKALANDLATRLPYSSFEQNLLSMRQAGINAANMTQSISGAYNSSVSKLNPVSMSL